jgi:predicted porin
MKMKKLVCSLISLGVLMMPSLSNAQSGVTLYGLLDAGVGYIKTNTGHEYAALTGNIHGDRWGIKGTEDLGGGLGAIFQLENGFSIMTGQLKQGGREFGRQAVVGLYDKTYGSILLGRQYDPIVDLVQGLTADHPFGGSIATPGDIDNYDNTMRTSNSIKYVSPSFGGLKFEGLYAFSGIAGSPGKGLVWSGAASYASGPASVAVGYFYASNPSGAPFRNSWSSPTADSLFVNPINDGYQSAHSMGITRAAGEYVFDKLTVGASYSNVQLKPDGQSKFVSNEHWNIGNTFASYQLSSQMLLGLGYAYTHASGDTSATYHQLSVGAAYNLSRRTELYGVAAYQHASGIQRTPAGGTRQAEASIGSYGIAAGATQEILILGVLHRF